MMEWKLDHSAGPRGYLVGTITITIPVEGVARLALDRPDKLNAFNSAMIGEIRAPMWRLNYDDSVRVIMLTGEGRGFSAGRDVNRPQDQTLGFLSIRALGRRRLVQGQPRLDRLVVVIGIEGTGGGRCPDGAERPIDFMRQAE